MSSATTRRAPPSQGGLAGLVSRFEKLDSPPKSRPGVGGAQKTRGRQAVASKIPGPSTAISESKRTPAEIPRSVTSRSLAPRKASLVKTGSLHSLVKDRRVGNSVAVSSAGVSSGGSVVAQRRKLFERGLDENVAPNVSQTATYEPKRVASPATVDDKAPASPASPVKPSSIVSERADVAISELQEEKNLVPDSMTPTSQVEHPEYLPPPLASSRPSSRNHEEAQSKKGTLQRGSEPLTKLQGGILLPKPPSPLKSMVVTDVGGWPSEPCDTIPEVVLSGSSSAKINLQRPATPPPDEQEKGELEALDLPSEVTLCYPCHDAVLSSTAGDALHTFHERSGPSLPASQSIPSPQSKVSSLRAKFDSGLPVSASLPSVSKRRSQADMKKLDTRMPVRPSSAIQVSLRPGSKRYGLQPAHSGTSPSKNGTLKDKIGLWESRSRQDRRASKSKIPRKHSAAATTKRISASQRQGKAAIRTFDGAPSPMLSPAETGSRRSSTRSLVVGSLSSQASDVKALPYNKPSLLKPSRQIKSFVYNVGEGAVNFEQQPFEGIQCPGAWPDEDRDGDDASPAKQGPVIVGRHPSLRLLGRRFLPRSQGLFFVSQARCTLEQPQPVRGKEMRRLTSLCRERMAALMGRAQTE
ncbi:hypothetical protein M440DRAFT_1339951 [Trichoderma longibrachiatum ATCC 18648]|uniref:Uncharacterized protein n=1 Tax=Trichoderma longibrachiatum ATCC 18648 TaxID=983965 RepID=A0A2T4BWF5_TRILO|nr:hypothetical protein M440DRAFT_1339951 [Trichoderma longibrachiatum ATCC 18648]